MMRIGTSGWMYDDWRGPFYPRSVPRRQWLEFYASEFDTVEVNNAFYRLPERATFEQWRARTPAGFCFAVKVSRYLTHIRRLRDPEEPVDRFMSRAVGLGDRLGPLLLQLPPTMRANAEALDATLAQFPAGVRVAVEPRHPSWWSDEVAKVLTARHAALVWADRLGRPATPLWTTTDWGYLRMHEGRATPRPGYGRTALASWLGRIRNGYGSDPEMYVYFNNDPGGAAIRDARVLAGQFRRVGTPITKSR